MSKAEDLAKEFLKKLVSHTTLYKGTIDELEVYEPDDVIWAYKEGYHKAEKDVAESFARIIRGNLSMIDKSVQDMFEQLYTDITGEKMYKGFKD